MGRTYGYARVSSTEQNLDRQIEALLEYGVEERDIVTDKQSGKDFQRKGYLALKNQMLRPSDTLVIKDYCAIIGLNQKDLENQGILA